MKSIRSVLLVVSIGLLFYQAGVFLGAAPQAELWSRWDKSDPNSNTRVDHYPVSSIRKIKRPWDTKLVKIEGEDITLNDIEHRILRPIWRDSRVHYAVNCASVGCPDLQPVAFTAKNLESLLNESAKDYINHERGVQFKGKTLQASSIFHWYESDFGGSVDSLVQHFLKYANPGLAQKLKGYRGKISYTYDWSLNGL